MAEQESSGHPDQKRTFCYPCSRVGAAANRQPPLLQNACPTGAAPPHDPEFAQKITPCPTRLFETFPAAEAVC